MMTEDYVSFETAKLLKEKGFDELCRSYWSDNHSLSFEHTKLLVSNDDESVYLLRPTLQMAMKWLREVHKLFIFISTWAMLEDNIQYYFEIREIKTHDFEILYDYTSKELNSFEKVAEAAIKYCLENLI